LAEKLATAYLDMRDADGAGALRLSDGDGITITNARTWAITVEPITPLPLSAGTYSCRLTMVSVSGDIRKWIKLKLSVIPE